MIILITIKLHCTHPGKSLLTLVCCITVIEEGKRSCNNKFSVRCCKVVKWECVCHMVRSQKPKYYAMILFFEALLYNVHVEIWGCCDVNSWMLIHLG